MSDPVPFTADPEPTSAEREALEQALVAAVRPAPAIEQRAWWERGLRDAVLGPGDGQSSSSKLWSTSQGAKPSRR